MKIKIKYTNSEIVMSPNSTVPNQYEVEPQWFEPDFWRNHQLIVGESKGSHTTWFVRATQFGDHEHWVLRHYYRGGFVAKLSKDKFLFTGITNTRPFKEFSLLLKMAEMQLPVPTCVGARVVRSGLQYSADLLMFKLDAVDLVGLLSSGSLNQATWQNIGEVISLFHRKGIYHADLNAHNIMLDRDEKVWLIDFDRCELKKVEPTWQQQNLQRLRRSFEKEKSIHSEFNFDQQCWDWLLEGYSAETLPH